MAIQYEYNISRVFTQDEGDRKDVIRKIFATIVVRDTDHPDVSYSVNSQINIDSPPEGQTIVPFDTLTKGQVVNMIESSRDGPGLRGMLQGNLLKAIAEKDYREKSLPWQSP